MARSTTPKRRTPIESIQHADKRINIPTADAATTFYDETSSALPPLLYARDPSLDPQLVWKGKDGQNGEDLVVDAPPIYIQEKIDPRAVIANIRAQGATSYAPHSDAPSLFNFEQFDELDDLSQLEFYQHEESWKNRMILGDSLQAMGSLAERETLRGKVQMVYMDPPYGIKFGSNWQVRAGKRDVKDGKLEDAAREAEQIRAFRDTWELGIHSYLSYLRDRLVIARDLLTDSGSVFVQIGDENVHLVRSLLDEVFGSENFVSQIAFRRGGFQTSDALPGTFDYILWCSKDASSLKWRRLYLSASVDEWFAGQQKWTETSQGTRERFTGGAVPKDARVHSHRAAYSASGGESSRFPVVLDGKTLYPPAGRGWSTNQEGMKRLIAADRLLVMGNSLRFKPYYSDFPLKTLTNGWTDTVTSGFGEDKLYVVQTASMIVARCMLMCTDPGDLVLDPTCGSGTTAFVAEHWGRRWITIDTSRVALTLARQRLMGARYPYFVKADTEEGRRLEGLPPTRTAGDIRQGFVYERVQQITLKSIANNPDIKPGMPRGEIEMAISKHADFELLYDKPKEDKSKVRVSGPFTMESLSPHRSLKFDEADQLRTGSGASDNEAGFDQTILANLRRAGIQNGHRAERIQFETLEQYSGTYVQAIGDRLHDQEDVAPTRIAVALGPQYGTVSPGFIKAAAKEAIADQSVDLLCVLGFAFDPQATGVTGTDGVTVVEEFASVEGERKLGRIQVLLVRMNADLLMGDELKKTGSGNLFTVFGEPDVSVDEVSDGNLRVTLNGVDVYDPSTGDVRSSSRKDIALWMIDTDYNEESFFVRHCYFLGDNDPYKSLKAALRADIDLDAWAPLYREESLPFGRPSTGRIAIKVINDYGDEVMKVITV
ncbi:site-specific DNA-methyltransferase [Naasia sp. SYSU D00948]|uniref:site-specific DNA-methyltransferase n=1 Tax=Naasia sp. SYSU D00948 TaxID=2817379 RepID=UPI001B310E77|nr:DNA methyltransferase [Naasia sp. SYSU D00948]